jgi:hypothetical protein
MIWELSGDTPEGELLNAAYRSLLDPLAGSVFETAAAPPTASPTEPAAQPAAHDLATGAAAPHASALVLGQTSAGSAATPR